MNDFERWTLPMTPEEIEQAKKAFLSWQKEVRKDYTLEYCTCFNCERQLNNSCQLQWDVYNTEGDCLLSK